MGSSIDPEKIAAFGSSYTPGIGVVRKSVGAAEGCDLFGLPMFN